MFAGQRLCSLACFLLVHRQSTKQSTNDRSGGEESANGCSWMLACGEFNNQPHKLSHSPLAISRLKSTQNRFRCLRGCRSCIILFPESRNVFPCQARVILITVQWAIDCEVAGDLMWEFFLQIHAFDAASIPAAFYANQGKLSKSTLQLDMNSWELSSRYPPLGDGRE